MHGRAALAPAQMQRPADTWRAVPPSVCRGSYVFLVDSQGRLRWRASGGPSEKELATLLRCTDELLAAEQKEAAQRTQLAAAAAEQQAAAAEEQQAQAAAEAPR